MSRSCLPHLTENGCASAPARACPISVFFVLSIVFLLPQVAYSLVITEIHFRPSLSEDPGEILEFIEIYNDESIVLDMSGYRFSSGVDFVFPKDTFLPARSHLVVCRSVDGIRETYGIENTIGNFFGRLDNNGEWIRVVNPMGSPVAEARYRNRGERTAGDDAAASADGTGFTLAIESIFNDTRDPDNWVRSGQPGGTPGMDNFPEPTPRDREIAGAKELWRYKKGWNEDAQRVEEFSDPPHAWRQPEFDDSSWLEGLAPIGMNEDIIETVLDDMRRNYGSFAMRREFVVEAQELASMESLVLRTGIDDGAIVYLNGAEVVRFQLPGIAGDEVAAGTNATTSGEVDNVREFVVPKDNIRVGRNVLAVQVHNINVGSADAGFFATVLHRTFEAFAGVHVPTVVCNEIVSRAPAEERNVEFYNLSDMAVDLSGFHLTLTPLQPDLFTFPDGSWISPRDFLLLTEADLGFSLVARDEMVSLFLYDPDGKKVLDAVRLLEPSDLAAEVQAHARMPDGGAWSVTPTPTPGLANQVDFETRVVINEIHFNPRLADNQFKPLDDTQRGEFVELHNRSNDLVPLDGFELKSGVRFTFGPEHVLPPRGYLVVAYDPSFIQDIYEISADLIAGPFLGTLSDRGETVRLEDPLGNLVDEVFYKDEGEWVDLADGGGSSLELIDPDQDNATPLAWAASEERHKSPWVEIEYEAEYPTSLVPGRLEPEMHIFLLSSGECLLDGISLTSNLSSEDPQEHISNGDFEEDTRPWRLGGNHIHSFRTTSEEAKFGDASLHLVATGGGNNKVNRIEVDIAQIVDDPVRVRLWARWLSGSNALHISGHNNAYGRTFWLPTPQQTGTPGSENSVRRSLREMTGGTNQGPVITDLRHEPAVPEESETVSFHARVTDSDGVQSVVLHYNRDSGNVEIENTHRVVTLLDDGSRNDGEPGDGHYSGDVPGFSNGSVVNFWIEATDNIGNRQNFPRGAPETEYSFVVDKPIESLVHRYRIVLNQDSQFTLKNRQVHSNDLVGGTFIFEESQVYYNVGYRYHGSPWNRPPLPKMFRVRFNGDRPFRHASRRINVSRYAFEQKEGTAYQLINKAGKPGVIAPRSPRYNYAKTRLNSGNHALSAMAEIGVVSKDYARFNWPQDSGGHAYKISGKIAFNDSGSMIGEPSWTSLRVYDVGPYSRSPSPENHRFYFNPKIKRETDSFDELIDLLKVMDSRFTPDEDYDEKIQEILNVESVLRVYLTRILQDDWDSIGIGNGQNAYLYFAPVEGRFYYIPWDMDHTFANAFSFVLPPRSGTGFRRLVTRPVFRRMYGRIIQDFLADHWSPEYLRNWIPRVEETILDARVLGGGGIIDFATNRVPRAQTLLNLADKSFKALTESPVTAKTSEIAITGEAPIALEFILVGVNGQDPEPREIRWSTSGSEIPFEWEVVVKDLQPGVNQLAFLGLSHDGEILGSIDGFEVIHGTAPFIRGEVNGDLRVNLTDVVLVLQHVFLGRALNCRDAADANDDAAIMSDDAIYLLHYLFTLGPPPAAPFPEAGFDTVESLGCSTQG